MDSSTGEFIDVEFFVMLLAASNYALPNVTRTQRFTTASGRRAWARLLRCRARAAPECRQRANRAASAVGRKAWLFFGSSDHAQAAANLFSLIASCRLHGLDAETYLAEVIRVVAYGPRDPYLEIAPKYWLATRARLDATELERPIGHVAVPPSLAAEAQASPS